MSKLIRLADATYEKLARRGNWHQSMDSIVLNLLQAVEEKEQQKESRQQGLSRFVRVSQKPTKKVVRNQMHHVAT
jgi:hypothetical protein